MKMKQLLFIAITLFLPLTAGSQQPAGKKYVDIERVKNEFKYNYRTLASDTAFKDGLYQFSYKNKILEKGNYKGNNKVGVWSFYNYEGALEYSYNFDSGEVFNFERQPDEVYDSPCFFLGSPVVIYRFVASNIQQPYTDFPYPKEQTMLLSLLINTEGAISGVNIINSFNADYDKAVLKAASKIPKHWRWIPARYGGKAIESEYIIKIIVSP